MTRSLALLGLLLAGRSWAESPTLPPVDATCRAASDCAIDARVIQPAAGGGWVCCSSCDARPVSKAWVAKADRVCADHGDRNGECPAKKCAWPKGVACVDSRCVLVSDAAPPTPKKFELVEGKPVDIGSGVTVELESVMYAHLTDSRNNSLLTMKVTRGATHEKVTLDRMDPVGKDGPKYRAVMGLRIAIDYVDAYHKPSTGAILVLPL
jgi:hypothetical protein